MKKLTATMEKVLNKIREDIRIAKSYDNYEDYYNEVEAKYYNERYNNYRKVLERYGEAEANSYKKYWENRRKNITLTSCSSATLRALEERGYIRIIEDGGRWTDRVELIER